MIATPLPPTRVIVWGTGAVGREMITAIIDHRPDLQIDGARVYSGDKDGADVGALVFDDVLRAEPRRDNARDGRDGAAVTFSSRSKRCGPSAASPPWRTCP